MHYTWKMDRTSYRENHRHQRIRTVGRIQATREEQHQPRNNCSIPTDPFKWYKQQHMLQPTMARSAQKKSNIRPRSKKTDDTWPHISDKSNSKRNNWRHHMHRCKWSHRDSKIGHTIIDRLHSPLISQSLAWGSAYIYQRLHMHRLYTRYPEDQEGENSIWFLLLFQWSVAFRS
jgi:hypothetical protein